MKKTRCFVVCLAILALSACSASKQTIVVYDYCARAARVELRDYCEEGVTPELDARGWGTCSLVTRADAEGLAAEAQKYDEGCRNE